MRTKLTIALIALVSTVLIVRGQSPAYDLLLRNAHIVDGTDGAWYRADLGIKGDTIATIGLNLTGDATRTIDVAEQVVAPGFIDIHTHARRGLAETPTAANYVRQGVTTVMEGPDGSSAVPLGPSLAEFDA